MNRSSLGLTYLNTLAPWKGSGSFSLQAMQETMERLGNPQNAYPVVHIAGTNGKGSVSVATAAILARLGGKVGLNLSPSLVSLNERIVIDGFPVNDAFLGEFAADVRDAAHKALIDLSFHEAITAVAYLGFREFGLAWAVMEVGLGGRLDASNVVARPVCTAIVSIDFDHENILGNSLPEIALEKAGIIKPSCTQVTGPVRREVEQVISAAARSRSADEFRFGRDFGWHSGHEHEQTFVFWRKSKEGDQPQEIELRSPLLGKHQFDNMSIAAALGCMVGATLDQCKTGIEGAFWPGRLEMLEFQGRKYLLDCAHNPAGVAALTSFLDREGYRGVDLVFGALEPKNWGQMISTIAPFVATWHLVEPQSDRAVPSATLRTHPALSRTEVSVFGYGRKADACFQRLMDGDPARLVVVAGSMYITGCFRELLGPEPRPLWKAK